MNTKLNLYKFSLDVRLKPYIYFMGDPERSLSELDVELFQDIRFDGLIEIIEEYLEAELRRCLAFLSIPTDSSAEKNLLKIRAVRKTFFKAAKEGSKSMFLPETQKMSSKFLSQNRSAYLAEDEIIIIFFAGAKAGYYAIASLKEKVIKSGRGAIGKIAAGKTGG